MEVDLVKNVRFEEGFSDWHARWPLDGLVTNGTKVVKGTFETTFSAPGNAKKSTSILWEVTIDGNTTDGTRWVGLGILSTLQHPLPILYRMVLFRAKSGVRQSWGSLHIFREMFSPIAWRGFSEPDDLEKLSESGASLHVFLSIPISLSKYPTTNADAMEPLFVVGDVPEGRDANDLRSTFARVFEQVVVRRVDDGAEEADDDVFEKDVVPRGDGDEGGMPEGDDDDDVSSDIYLTVIDKKKKTERRFDCHRSILAARSGYFRRRLRRRRSTYRSNMPTIVEEDADPGAIEFDDVDEETMEIALRWIYTSRLPALVKGASADDQDHAKVLKIAMAAAKLELGTLKEYCLSILLFDYVTDNNRVDQLQVVANSTLDQLKVVCLEQLSTAFASGAEIDLVIPTFLPDSKEEILKMAKEKIFNYGMPVATSE